MNAIADRREFYVHKPLESQPASHQIRLLKILPASDQADEVRCEIFNSSLDNHPYYEALSYAWGDPSITLPIRLNGKTYHVTSNLESALRHLRLATERKVMWVDAICINQRDPTEKSHQVGQMRDIYRNAKQVLVWLGEEGDVGMALEFLTQIAGEHVNLKNFMEDRYEAKWAACEALFNSRAWWRRVSSQRCRIKCSKFLVPTKNVEYRNLRQEYSSFLSIIDMAYCSNMTQCSPLTVSNPFPKLQCQRK
jgi:hypothetical protein